MNTGQSLFSIAALLFLSLIILRVNNSILTTDSVMYDSKFGLLATSIATSIIEKAISRPFDENTLDSTDVSITSPTFFSSTLGPEGSESPDFPDDFDDFNGYTQKDTFFNSLVFTSSCKVFYINPANLEVQSSTRTWHKRLTVTVTWKQNDENTGVTTDSIKHSTIYSYWYFAL